MKGDRVGRRLRRGAYLVPSLFTMGNAFLGFYAVVRGFRGQFEAAALLVFAAAVVDSLDGLVARLTNTESEFGKEYDSLADVLTFGATPALLTFFWCFGLFGRLGWLIPIFYLLATATRLARFNVQAAVVDSRFFVGLPTPAAAGAVCSIFLFADNLSRATAGVMLLTALVVLGVLMVSTFRYPSVKKIDLRRRWSYRTALPVAAVLLLLAYEPRVSLAALAIAYALSGPTAWLVARVRGRHSEAQEPVAGESGGEAQG